MENQVTNNWRSDVCQICYGVPMVVKSPTDDYVLQHTKCKSRTWNPNDYARRHTKCKGRTWNSQWLCPKAYEMQGPDLKPPMIMPNDTRNEREGRPLEIPNDYAQRHTKCKGRTWNPQNSLICFFFLQKIKRGALSNSYTFGAPLD